MSSIPTSSRQVLVTALVAGATVLCQAPASASTTVTIGGEVKAYVARDYSQNYTEVSSFPGIAYVGIFTSGRYPEKDGRMAATFDFLAPTLPTSAVVTSAKLIFKNYETFEGPNVYEVDTYTAPSSIVDPARANVRTPATTFQLYVSADPFQVDVTSALLANLAASPSYPDIGFSIRQIADNCGASGNFNDGYPGYDCSARFGDTSVYEQPLLSITYDIASPPPPVSTVPEPANWAMLAVAFGLVGAGRRRWRRA
jgi:hypothetical protein